MIISKSIKFFLYLFVFLAGLLIIGINLPLNLSNINFEVSQGNLTEDLDKYLDTEEGKFTDINEWAKKRIIWSNSNKDRTSISLVYIHGFSATLEEIRPVPDLVAEKLGANLYFSRLTGHGKMSGEISQVSLSYWIKDVSEAIRIGSRIGEKTFILATSTGATLVSAILAKNRDDFDLAGVVFISPNFAIKSFSSKFLTLPFVNYWGPFLIGEKIINEPLSLEHEKYWSLTYSTKSVIELANLVKFTNNLNFKNIKTPALFFYSNEDKVVDTRKTSKVIKRWGGEVEDVILKLTASDDPYSHVIAGKIRSPNQTRHVVEKIIYWIENLN